MTLFGRGKKSITLLHESAIVCFRSPSKRPHCALICTTRERFGDFIMKTFAARKKKRLNGFLFVEINFRKMFHSRNLNKFLSWPPHAFTYSRWKNTARSNFFGCRFNLNLMSDAWAFFMCRLLTSFFGRTLDKVIVRLRSAFIRFQ